MVTEYFAAGFVQGEYLEAWAVAKTFHAAYDAAKTRMQSSGYSHPRFIVKKIGRRAYRRARFRIEKGSWHYLRLSDHRLSETEFEALFVPTEGL